MSIILQRADDYIYNNTTEDFTKEITQENDWIGEDNEEIYKLQTTNSIKIIFLSKKGSEYGHAYVPYVNAKNSN